MKGNERERRGGGRIDNGRESKTKTREGKEKVQKYNKMIIRILKNQDTDDIE